MTSVTGLVEAQQYMFENLWKTSIPAIQKIKEIEQGIKPDIIETITDPIKIQNRYLNLVRSATKEIMLIIPTANAIYSQAHIGILQLLKEVGVNHNNNKSIDTRILAPQKNDLYYIVEQQQQQQQQKNKIHYCLFLFLPLFLLQ